jgi:pimeloyl-ACP methyl ester carboxylesterase
VTQPRRIVVGPAPRIALDVAGSGPLVLFLHGIGGNRTHWDDQLAAFAPEFTAAAWDARGYGDSDDYDGPLAFADLAADLLRVLDFLGAERAHLVGLSLGGRIARDFCLRHPERVATLALCNTHAGFDDLAPEAVDAFLRARQEPLAAGKELRDLAPALARGIVGKSAVPGAYHRLVASLSTMRKSVYLRTLEASVREDRGALVERIAVPALVVTSDEDAVYPPATAEALARRIRGVRLAVIPGAGHVSNLDQPARFNATVLGFLREHRTRAATVALTRA